MRFFLKKFNRLILKGYILILLFIFPAHNSFAAMVTHNQSVSVEQSINALISGIHFNKDGTKMFTTYNKRLGGDILVLYKNMNYLNLLISLQEFLQVTVNDAN